MASQQLIHVVLPTKIVHLIMYLFATPLSTHELQLFPWFLGHICSTWRSIFLSMTAEFWSRISIWFSQWKNCIRTKNVVRFFLERNSATSFSFEVKSLFRLYECQQHEEDHTRQTLDMLMDTSMHWKDALFILRVTDLLPLLRAKHRLPLLQKIQIYCWPCKVPDLLLDVFQDAPRLNDVVVHELGDWKFNFENLKAISMDMLGSGAPHFITALPRMTKLKRLRIGTAFDDKMLSSIIRLPNLTILSCRHTLLRFLEAPALEDLTIESNTCNPFNLNVDSIRAFLSRSSCAMHILSLGIIRAASATAIDIIKLIPQLTHLNLSYVNNRSRNVLEALTISTNSPQEPLARHMLSLSITDFDKSENYDHLLISLVSSRTGDDVADNDDYKRLRKLDISCIKYNVSKDAQYILIALCKERGVQYVGPE